MDIQKELNAFKAVAQSKGWNTDGETTQTNYLFYCLTTNSGWKMWQAAKAQAVPEGFVLVPEEPTRELYRTFYDAFNSANAGNTAQCFKIAYKAMIEAQEQSHEHS